MPRLSLHLGYGPNCSGRALAQWLGVSHTYIQKLTRTLSRHDGDFLREMPYSGPPTLEELREAREESREQRTQGLLRRPRRWKAVECKIGDTAVRAFVPTKPSLGTLAADSPLRDTPTLSNSNTRKLDHQAIYTWHLRINAERKKLSTRWRPGRRY